MRAVSRSLRRSFTGTNEEGIPRAPGSLSAPGWEAMDLRPVAYLLAKPTPAAVGQSPELALGRRVSVGPIGP